MPSASFSHLPPLFVTSRDGLSRVRLQEISTLVSALSFGIHLFASFAFTSAAQAAKLYERCLVVCANYPKYWMRYVDFMETKGGREIEKY
ncbi:pre-mRNA-processing factor 39-2-like isoform X1 [Prosopis cineraria]|uniref:pre-mRNA-processing factor 39-2-like isoform X1 n=1 Tax=Prosopis cineraria TaxID=364024 RepID=UPI002410B2DE|nr:pre-mRNA-processing factor 39-2-like isoform X1 [Prosopis cineraria]